LERVVTFEVLGQKFSLNTDAPQEEVDETLEMVRSQLEKNSYTSSMLPAKLGILVSLNIASQYVQLKNEFERYEAEQSERLCSLIGKIETIL